MTKKQQAKKQQAKKDTPKAVELNDATLDQVSGGAVGVPGANITDGTSNTILKK